MTVFARPRDPGVDGRPTRWIYGRQTRGVDDPPNEGIADVGRSCVV